MTDDLGMPREELEERIAIIREAKIQTGDRVTIEQLYKLLPETKADNRHRRLPVNYQQSVKTSNAVHVASLRFWIQRGREPSSYDLARMTGLHPTTCLYHIRKLRRGGNWLNVNATLRIPGPGEGARAKQRNGASCREGVDQ